MLFVTEIEAIDPASGELKIWCGPEVPGINEQTAIEYCQTHGLGYCKVIGQLIAEIPCKLCTHEPDFDGLEDFENLN